MVVPNKKGSIMRRIMLIALFIASLTVGDLWAAGSPVRIDDGDTLTNQADVTVTTTATLVKASNSNRAALNCTTDGDVRWGPSSVTAVSGQLIPANSSIEIRSTAAVYMIVSVTSATVSCTEESYSSSSGPIFSP